MASGRLSDAVSAYDNAIKLKHDALVRGRLGLALMMFEDPKVWVDAAMLLQSAVSEMAGVSAAERREFFNAYERVRRHVCKLEVVTNDVNSDIDLGNGSTGPSHGAFWTFVAPGKHTLIARLKGREDITRS